tara:strand:+ start:260 stop:457 length:198 start_codon:yes stop_codon:yes gene_type:complete
MSKKNKSQNRKYNAMYDDDMDAMKGKGTRRENRRAKRHREKVNLNDVLRGDIDPDEYMDYVDQTR